MEKWQREHIVANLPELISNTRVDTFILSCFESKNVLSKEEVERIITLVVNYDKAYNMYSIIQTKVDGYMFLLEALDKAKQSGALSTLLRTAPNLVCQNLTVVIGNAKILMADVLSEHQLQELNSWVKEHINFEIYKTLVSSEKPITLGMSNIPESDPLYIPRYLSRRLVIHTKAFNVEENDIFVFKNIPRLDLRNFIGNGSIESSSEQIFGITSRFILLDNSTHWNELRTSADTPIHLVAFIDNPSTFLLEETSGNSENLQKFLEYGSNTTKILEIELICNERTDSGKGLCICDSPGMGKTMLLASLAKYTQTRYPDRLVSFIRLSKFAHLLNEVHSVSINFETVKDFLMEQLTTSSLTKRLLHLLFDVNMVKMELFFDGLDEVQTDHLSTISRFFVIVLDKIPNCRVYATSRTHLRKELESVTRFIAYDIVPFDEETQANYLVSVWHRTELKTEKPRLLAFAHQCLEMFRKNVNDRGKNLLGIPLQCRIFANIYAKSARAYSLIEKHKNFAEHHFVKNVHGMYKLFMEQRFSQSECNFLCMVKKESTWHDKYFVKRCSQNCKVKCLHTWIALKTVFPRFADEMAQEVSDFKHVCFSDLVRPGIVVKRPGKTTLAYLHRSFAEYACAEFFSCQLLVDMGIENGSRILAQRAITFLFAKLLKTNAKPSFVTKRFLQSTFKSEIDFRYPLVVYFFEHFVQAHSAMDYSLLDKFSCFNESNRLTFFLETCAALKSEYINLLQIFVRLWLKSNKVTMKSMVLGVSQFLGTNKLYSTQDQKLYILNTATRYSNLATITVLVDLFKEIAHIDLLQVCQSFKTDNWSPLDIALRSADYAKFCIFYPQSKERGLMYALVAYTIGEDKETLEKRKEIINCLLENHPSSLNEVCELESRKYTGPVVAPEISVELIAYLVEKGADIRATQDNHVNIIGAAAVYMNGTDFQKLTEFVICTQNAPDLFNSTDAWISPLPYVFSKVKCLSLETVQMIFGQTRANVNELGENDFNLFQFAISGKQNVNILKFLVSKGACISHFTKQKYTSLHIALECGNNEALLYLTSLNYINIETRNKYGQTPILVAAQSNNLDMIEHLHNMGANLFALDNKENSILLAFVLGCSDEYMLHKFVLWLRKKCAAICQVSEKINDTETPVINKNCLAELFGMSNRRKETPILAAFSKSNVLPETCKIFLQYGKSRFGKCLKHPVDINAADQEGNTVLQACIKGRQPVSMVKLLVGNGLEWKVNEKSYCNVAHDCVMWRNHELLKYFVELGSDKNGQDPSSNNALQCCFHFQLENELNEEALIALSQSGLNFEKVNLNGKTAMMMIKKCKYYKDCFKRFNSTNELCW